MENFEIDPHTGFTLEGVTVSIGQDDIAEADCCGGFVGEYWCDYIQDEARTMFEAVLADKRAQLAAAMAASIEAGRPDMYA